MDFFAVVLIRLAFRDHACFQCLAIHIRGDGLQRDVSVTFHDVCNFVIAKHRIERIAGMLAALPRMDDFSVRFNVDRLEVIWNRMDFNDASRL